MTDISLIGKRVGPRRSNIERVHRNLVTDFSEHVRHLDSATKLTQHLPNSQLKTADGIRRKVIDAGVVYFEALAEMDKYLNGE